MRFAAGNPTFEPLSRTILTAGKIALLLCFLAMCAYVLAGGSLTRALLVLVIACAPIALYVAIKWPLIFPFAMYVVMVPLNDILSWPQFGTLSKALGALAFVALALWLVRTRLAIQPPLSLLAWLGLALWMTLSGMWALQRADWWQLLPTFLQLFCLYAIVCLLPARGFELRAVWFAIIGGGLLAGGLGIYDFLHGNGFYGHRLYVATASGDVVDPNHFAGALLLPVCVTLTAALSERRWHLKLGLALCFCALMIAIYLSGSRDALVSIVLAFVYLLWRTTHRRQLGAFLAVAALAAIPLSASLAARFSTAASTGGAGRLYIWQVGLHSLKQYWLFGAGLGNFPNAFYEFYTQIYTRSELGWPRAGHNLLLTSAVELGVLGTLLMLVAWGAQFLLLKQINRTSVFYESRIALEASVIALFVASFFLDNMYRKYTWLVFCAMALLRSRYVTEMFERPAALSFLDGAQALQRSHVRPRGHPDRSDAEHSLPLP